MAKITQIDLRLVSPSKFNYQLSKLDLQACTFCNVNCSAL